MSLGEVAEWSIAAVLKTVELRGSGGSNPSLSARSQSKKVSRNRHLLFFIPWHKFTCRQRYRKQKTRLAAFCAVGLQGPLRRAEGMGVKRGGPLVCPVANPSLSALNNLQGVDFQPYRLFYTQKVAPKNAPTPILRVPTYIKLSSYAATISEMVAVFVLRKNNYSSCRQ